MENNAHKRKPRVGDIVEVRMPSGVTKRLRIVDKDASEVGEDECLLHSAAVTRGRIVEEVE